jgi:hypothetical protein
MLSHNLLLRERNGIIFGKRNNKSSESYITFRENLKILQKTAYFFSNENASTFSLTITRILGWTKDEWDTKSKPTPIELDIK